MAQNSSTDKGLDAAAAPHLTELDQPADAWIAEIVSRAMA
jgi:hypothetical protein